MTTQIAKHSIGCRYQIVKFENKTLDLGDRKLGQKNITGIGVVNSRIIELFHELLGIIIHEVIFETWDKTNIEDKDLPECVRGNDVPIGKVTWTRDNIATTELDGKPNLVVHSNYALSQYWNEPYNGNEKYFDLQGSRRRCKEKFIEYYGLEPLTSLKELNIQE
jgi:hypothetical protein